MSETKISRGSPFSQGLPGRSAPVRSGQPAASVVRPGKSLGFKKSGAKPFWPLWRSWSCPA